MLRSLWDDGRSPLASPGRRMLRVFGRLAKSVGVIAFIFCAIIFIATARSIRVSEAIMLLFAMLLAASCLLIIVASLASFLDGVLAGLNGEDESYSDCDVGQTRRS